MKVVKYAFMFTVCEATILLDFYMKSASISSLQPAGRSDEWMDKLFEIIKNNNNVALAVSLASRRNYILNTSSAWNNCECFAIIKLSLVDILNSATSWMKDSDPVIQYMSGYSTCFEMALERKRFYPHRTFS